MSVLTRYLPPSPTVPAPTAARGDAFFSRVVPLAEGEPAVGQIALAVEALSPFPPEQLYYGYILAADGRSALVFAAFRRRFSEEELAGWSEASRVVPEFVALLPLGPGPAGGAQLVLHRGAQRVTVLAWREGAGLPALVASREGDEAIAAALLEETRVRVGLPVDAPVRALSGELSLRDADDGGLEGRCGGELVGVIEAARCAGADVRDPEFLVARRRAQARDRWLWRGMLGALVLLALALVGEIAGRVLAWRAGHWADRVAAQAETVRQTETAQALANRIAELSEKRLLAFEMLGLANVRRPDSVLFERAATRGLDTLEIAAQATNAEDVRAYTTALRELSGILSVDTRLEGARDGVTRFVLSLKFNLEALRKEGAVP